MKLILQIAFGVFLGSLGSGLLIDYVHTYQDQTIKEKAAKKKAEEEANRRQQGKRIRDMLLQHRKRQALEGERPMQGLSPKDMGAQVPPQLSDETRAVE